MTAPVEQFDVQGIDQVVAGYGEGWFEQEYDPDAVRHWRWMGPRAVLKIHHAGQDLMVKAEATRRSPRLAALRLSRSARATPSCIGVSFPALSACIFSFQPRRSRGLPDRSFSKAVGRLCQAEKRTTAGHWHCAYSH